MLLVTLTTRCNGSSADPSLAVAAWMSAGHATCQEVPARCRGRRASRTHVTYDDDLDLERQDARGVAFFAVLTTTTDLESGARL